MGHPNYSRYFFVALFMLAVSAGETSSKAKVPAVFTFGDSIMDPGNNNFINTDVKANHTPYGIDFIDHKPTGRYTDGKLSADFIVSWLGLKETLPPFLDPHLSTEELLTGVSFASAGSGYDNLTANAVNVMTLWKQAELFKSYNARLQNLVGEQNVSDIVGQSLLLVSSGTNDFLQNYFRSPKRRKQFSVGQYQDFLIRSCSNFVEELYKLGARKIGVYGIPPQGCLPVQKALYNQLKRKGCFKKLNWVAVSYNAKLNEEIERMKSSLPGAKVGYVNIYDVFLELVKHPAKHGFEASHRGCCGTGLVEIGPNCNERTPVTCTDPSKYVFWDAVHPTERGYKILSEMVFQNLSKLL